MSVIEKRDSVQQVAKQLTESEIEKHVEQLQKTQTHESNLVVVVLKEELFTRSIKQA